MSREFNYLVINKCWGLDYKKPIGTFSQYTVIIYCLKVNPAFSKASDTLYKFLNAQSL